MNEEKRLRFFKKLQELAEKKECLLRTSWIRQN